MRCVVVPEKVRGRARSMGQKGQQWLDSLDLTIATLEERWQIQVGETLEGGKLLWRERHREVSLLF